MRHLAGRGCAVVCAPLRRLSFTRKQIVNYVAMIDGYEACVRRYAGRIDTARIGIVGHGFGGGMAPAIMRQLIRNKRWGAAGAFMFIMAPWYTFGIDARGLQDFPKTVSLVAEIFDNDDVNDPRIAADLYENIAIPNINKSFLIVHGDSRGDCRLRADSDVPIHDEEKTGPDALDYYAVYRIADALAAAVFEHSAPGREIAIGNGKPRLVFAGAWPDGVPVREITAVDSPSLYLPRKFAYVNSWRSMRNPRIDATPLRMARKLFFWHFLQSARLYAGLAPKSLDRDAERDADSDYDAMPNPIDSGFGAQSASKVLEDSLLLPTTRQQVYWFLPDTPAQSPVVLFLHGYSGRDPQSYQPFINHIVSRGNSVIFPTYPLMPPPSKTSEILDKYRCLYEGIDSALSHCSGHIDTTRAGIFGHSFGGGAAPAVAYRYFVNRGFGRNGIGMFIAAPWFSFDITPEQMARLPKSGDMIIEVYDDDHVNDHAMAVDLYRSIPARRRQYVTLFSDSCDGYDMPADHFVPYGESHIDGRENMLDYYGVWRLFDALLATVFRHDSAGGAVAFGNGRAGQTFMGDCSGDHPVHPLSISNDPHPDHPEIEYVEMWDKPANPRRNVK
jgi:dienelactone hydrolase